MRLTLFLILMSLLIVVPLEVDAAETHVIQREDAPLRKGPGAFYPQVARIPKGTELTSEEAVSGWFETRYNELSGFVSLKTTEPPAPSADVFSSLAFKPANVKLSQYGMSAGAKGFAMNFSKRVEGNAGLIEQLERYQVDPQAYARFKEETYQDRNLQTLHKRYEMPPSAVRSQYTDMETGLGLGIASKIGSLQLYTHAGLTDYLNYVGNLVAESSPAYDLPLKFFIIDVDQANAYACPGGYIFVTRGLLQAMQNEAELAAVLAHEVAHVMNQDGLRELSKRKVIVVAENAFAELQEALPEEQDPNLKAAQEELDSFALSAYETIFEGRLADYELEADAAALLICARSGYTPSALKDLLERLIRKQSVSTNEHYSPPQLKDRAKQIGRQLHSRSWRGDFKNFSERWESHRSMLP
jgi:hypothetical protein